MKMRSAKFLAAIDAYNNDRLEVATQLIRECADSGDPVACLTLARWSRDGEAIPHIDGEVARWSSELRKLADAGDAEAQWELGQSYRFGDLMPMDVEEANRWLWRAATSGNADAQHHLAWYLEHGEYGISVDREMAEGWYKRAFDSGHEETVYLFAIRLLHSGKTGEAIQLLERAAQGGLKQAAEVLVSLRE
ncbi:MULTISPECIES: tetratricopeptide repeat protein [unclassified Bradyrhizobium]|uniref:tetratricopeptide repeat protein n=1 Tax=unclassified Bradyrhizobium TaxID=2631580 RepID=UPI0028F11424|nr:MULTISPECIES: tetratricopeptide repeat protein [unclassified Bradyrhizobium]